MYGYFSSGVYKNNTNQLMLINRLFETSSYMSSELMLCQFEENLLTGRTFSFSTLKAKWRRSKNLFTSLSCMTIEERTVLCLVI